MTVKIINPDTLPDALSLGYSQITTCTPGELVFISGQVAITRAGDSVPESLEDQAEIAVANLMHALEAAGSSPSLVTMIRIFIVELDPEKMNTVGMALRKAFGEHVCSATAVGVTSLASPEYLVEIEAMAVTA